MSTIPPRPRQLPLFADDIPDKVDRRRVEARPCVQCGILFRPPPRRGWGHRKLCSRTCQDAYRARDQATIVCAYCGKTFKTKRAFATRKRYCSKVCYTADQRRQRPAWPTTICKMCGRVIAWPPSRYKQAVQAGWTITYCSIACRKRDPATKERLRAMTAAQNYNKTPTRPERIAYRILDRIGVPYQPHAVVHNKFCVDAFVPSHNLVIEVDGDYWHANPAMYPVPNAIQCRAMHRDRAHAGYMAAMGTPVIRIWEHDLLTAPQSVEERLRAALDAADAYRSF